MAPPRDSTREEVLEKSVVAPFPLISDGSVPSFSLLRMSYQSESSSASSCEVSEAAEEYNEEVYTRRDYAGKRTYFLDVKSTRSGDDFFVTITERKRLQGGGQKKFRVFLYKEDFGEFVRALHDVIHHIRE